MITVPYKPKLEVPQSFEPKPNDIIGAEFIPPYRFIFENQRFDEKEQNLINEFKKFDVYSQIDPGYWNDANLLRFIQGSGYNLEFAKQNILAHQEWRNSNIVNLDSTFHDIESFLVD